MSVAAEAAALGCMQFMAKASLSDKGQVIDAGLDLNMDGGFGESDSLPVPLLIPVLSPLATRYCKDIVILMVGLQVVATVSTYAWLAALAVPAFAGFKLWTGILSPWIFAGVSSRLSVDPLLLPSRLPTAEAPAETEADAKRRMKKERKTKRI